MTQPLTDLELDELQSLLDAVPAPLEPLDVSMLDGFLCGVLLQPRAIPAAAWLPHVTDVEARIVPARVDVTRLHALAQRRHAELSAAIGARQWFDPWVFELMPDEADGDLGGGLDDDHEDDDEPAAIDAVYPWVAGFATALDLFPELMAIDAKQTLEPLALIYRHLAADDLEDADDLLHEIESLEPPADLAEAVEELVRASLLLADVSRPLPTPNAKSAKARRGPPPRGRSPSYR